MQGSIRSDAGMSIVTVLVALTISGFLLMAVAESMRTATFIRSYIGFTEDATSLRDEVKILLEPPALCTYTFGGVTLDTTIIGENAATQAQSAAYGLKENLSDPSPQVIGNLKWGQARATSASIQLRRDLGDDIYLAAIHINFDGETLLLQPAPKTIPVTLSMVPGTGEIQFCSAYADFHNSIVANSSSGGSLQMPDGQCPSGEYMTGLNNGEIVCSDGSVISNPTGPYSPSNPGPGCSGTSCVTFDYGPCTGTSCITNGTRCDGVSCIAYGAMASCSGTSCCAGPSCNPF